MSRASAFAKINLALVVGSLSASGKHEVVTVLQDVDLADEVELRPAAALEIRGFPSDTLVRAALEELAGEAGVVPGWSVTIEKRIPVAAGLGGGSSDAATALLLANAGLEAPLSHGRLQEVAGRIGADVPFFLERGARLGAGDGSDLAPLRLPCDYVVLLALPDDVAKVSTEDVYRQFDEGAGAEGFAERREELLSTLARVECAADLASLPRNDLASSPLSGELERLEAFRADVTGAGPAVYALFEHPEQAEHAAEALRGRARTWLVRPLVAA